MKNKKVTAKSKRTNEKFSFKTYLKDFLMFLDKNIIKTTRICFVIAILLVAIALKPTLTVALAEDCVGSCRDGVTLLSEYSSKLQVLLVTAFAGIVPYIYAPIVGFIGYILAEVSSLAFIMKGYGYAVGIAIAIVPLILNVLIICIITAVGIYICRTVTLGYKISNMKNMNFTNFKLELYKTMKKEQKVKDITKKKDEKLNNLQQKKEKINYLQILNIAILICIIQFVSVLIQEILL